MWWFWIILAAISGGAAIYSGCESRCEKDSKSAAASAAFNGGLMIAWVLLAIAEMLGVL